MGLLRRNKRVRPEGSEKEIIIVRHALSIAQTSGARKDKLRAHSAEMIDTKLSTVGKKQLANVTRPSGVELIVTSPLARAIQTACIVFEGATDVPIVAHPDLSEFPMRARHTSVENQGRSLSEIFDDAELQRLARFKDIDFGEVVGYEASYGTPWWNTELNMVRAEAKLWRFKQWLAARPERRIAIVGHCNSLMCLTKLKRRIPNGVPFALRAVRNEQSGCAEIERSDLPGWILPGFRPYCKLRKRAF